MRQFQQLVLLLDPMLQASIYFTNGLYMSVSQRFLAFMLYLTYTLTRLHHSQADVDEVNRKVEERLKKRGRKDFRVGDCALWANAY